MPHIGHGGIVYAGANAAYGLLRLPHRACLRYIHLLRRLEHLFHLKTSVMGASLAGIRAICFRNFVLRHQRVRGIW
jgi:hypothetical protein